MAFFDFLKRVPGGTDAGNILRDIASTATGGVLGSGAAMISQTEYDARNLSDTQFLAKYGYARSTVNLTGFKDAVSGIFTQVPTQPGTSSTGSVLDRILSPINNQVRTTSAAAGEGFMSGILKKYWWVLLLPFGVIIFLLIRLRTGNKHYK